MTPAEIEINSLANLLVDEVIRSAFAKGIDLADAEITLSFAKSASGEDCVYAKLVSNVTTVSLNRTSSFFRSERAGLPSQKGPLETNRERPTWDGRQLCLDGRIVKRYRNPGPNQQAVLSAFEEEGWPDRIDNPLRPTPTVDAQSRLSDTIKSLNRNHKIFAIRFHGDGSGEGVTWRRVSDALGDSE